MNWKKMPSILAALGLLFTATTAMAQGAAPTGTVKINVVDAVEAVATKSTLVTLTLTAVDDGGGPIRMCISNTATCRTWRRFRSTKRWYLLNRNGLKTVNVWFRDSLGNRTPKETPYSDTILLDRSAPKGGTLTKTQGIAQQLTLNWSGFTDGEGSGIAGYRAVFQKGAIAPLSCTVGTPVPGYSAGTSLVHTGLNNGRAYSYRICAVDAAGNMSRGATVTGKPVDTTSPTGTVTINGGAAATNSTAATLALTAEDDGGGAIQMCISDTGTCNDWTAFAATQSWTLAVGSGTATVNVWYRDPLGNTSATPISDTIVVDTTPPTGTVTINGGAAATNSTAATLALTAEDDGGGAIQMCISDTATCSDWTTFAATPSWTLAVGSGTATVNVWYRDPLGNTSAAPISDTIVVDTTSPTGTVTINGGAAATNSTAATLALTAEDDGGGAIQMCISDTGTCNDWTAFAATQSWTLAVGSGTATVNVWYRDPLGNTSATPISDTIVVDTTPPTGTVTINGGAAATNSTAATLALTAEDDGGGAIQMCISDTATCSDWTAFAATQSWTLAVGSGTATVNVWYRDPLGNTSAAPISDTIVVDTTPPTDGTLTVTAGVTQQLTLSLSGFTDAEGSGVTGYQAVFQVVSAPASCTSGTLVPGYAGTAMTIAHTGLVNGTTYGYRVCAIDAAGNMSTGATATGQPEAIVCELCHNGNPDYPLAPNVMGDGTNALGVGTVAKPYDDGTWGYNVNGHGANGTAPNTPRDDMGDPVLSGDAACTACHDISNSPGTHLDGVLNSVELKLNPNTNTAHLIAPYIGVSSPEWSVQLTFDNRCSIQCHPSSIRHRHSQDGTLQRPAVPPHPIGAVRFGDKGVGPYNGELIPYPIDSALSTNASTSEPDFVPCIACHNPHGTSVVEADKSSNRMLRANWIVPSTLCTLICHRSYP